MTSFEEGRTPSPSKGAVPIWKSHLQGRPSIGDLPVRAPRFRNFPPSHKSGFDPAVENDKASPHLPTRFQPMEISDQGFVKVLGNMRKEILQHVQSEMAQSTEYMRGQVQEIVDVACKERDEGFANVLRKIQHVQETVNRAPGESAEKVDSSTDKITSDIQSKTDKVLQRLESQLSQKASQILEEMQTAQHQREEMHVSHLKEFRDELKKVHLANDVQEGFLQSQDRQLSGLETQLSQKASQIVEELQVLQRQHEQSHNVLIVNVRDEIQKVLLANDIHEVLEYSKSQIDLVYNTQRALTGDSSQTIRDVKKIQQELFTLHSELAPCVETHLVKHLTRMDTSQVLTQMGKTQQAVHVDLIAFFSEISKIQQALNLDFAQVMPLEDEPLVQLTKDTKGEVDASVHSKHSKRKRVREFWSQTDPPSRTDNWAQTDDSLEKAHHHSHKKHARRNTDESQRKNKESREDKRKSQTNKMFADANEMKAKVRQALIKPQYNVFDSYNTQGVWQHIAKSPVFDNLTMLCVLTNAVWIAVDADNNGAAVLLDAHPVFQVAENIFCCYFTFELTVRFMAFKSKRLCLKDAWFMFDSVLVTLMVLETWVLTSCLLLMGTGSSSGGLGNASVLRMARMAKLTRIARMARLLRAIPELVILLKGVGVASRSVGAFLLLWAMVIFIFAIVLRQLTDNSSLGTEYFHSVPSAMNTLMLEGILTGHATLVNKMSGSSPLFFPVIMLFVLLAAITIMYMLVGVLVEVVGAVATTEREAMLVRTLASRLRDTMESLGYDPNLPLSKVEFQKLLGEPGTATVISDVGVDLIMLVDMSDIIFEDIDTEGKGLSFESFVDVLLNMRGSNPATVKDTKEILRLTKSLINSTFKSMTIDIAVQFAQVRGDIRDLRDEEREERGMLGADDDDDDDNDDDPDIS